MLYYGGSASPVRIDERSLAHLKVVMSTKLRRNESFTLTWRHPDDEPEGRSTIWVHPSIPLRFRFDAPEPPALCREWIEELAASANSSGGIVLECVDSASSAPARRASDHRPFPPVTGSTAPETYDAAPEARYT